MQKTPTKTPPSRTQAPKTLNVVQAWEWILHRIAVPDPHGRPRGICACIATLAGQEYITPQLATRMMAQLESIRPPRDEGPCSYYWPVDAHGRASRVAAINKLLTKLRTQPWPLLS